MKHNLVEEALIHMNWDELEEVLVKQRENLDGKEMTSKPTSRKMLDCSVTTSPV